MGEPTTKKPLTDLAVKQAKPREKVWCLVVHMSPFSN